MNKKHTYTHTQNKTLDSPKLQEIRAGPDLEKEKGEKEKPTENRRKLLHDRGRESVQALRTLDN